MSVKKRTDPHATHTSVVCSFELLHTRDRVNGGVDVLYSSPLREDVQEKHWTAHYGILTASQVQDLTGWISQAVAGSLVQWTGVQQELPRV